MSDHTQRVAMLSPAKKALLEKMLKQRGSTNESAAGIPKCNRSERLPLSFSQRRLWFLTQLGESGPAYNIVSAIHMKGALDVPALESAVAGLIARHEALRTRFPAFHGEPFQEICPPEHVSLEPFGCQTESQALELLSADAWTGFDLERGPLVRLRLYRLGPFHHVLSLVMHHIISDGWSTGVITRELTELYSAANNNREPNLAVLPIQYVDFSQWQHQRLSGSHLSELLRYWQSRLDGMPRVLNLPLDLPRPDQPTFHGRWLNFSLDAQLTGAIEQLGTRFNATPFMTLLAAFGLLLGRLAGTSDLAIGVPVANRTHPDLEPLAGFFVNTLIMRLQPSGNGNFSQYLREVQRTALGAFQHQDLPFERLVEELRPERELSRNPVIQVVFAFQQTEAMQQNMSLPGLETTPLELHELPVRFDIELHMWKERDCFHGAFIYGTDLFLPATMQAWLEHFTALLRAVVKQPDAPLSTISSYSDGDLLARGRDRNGPPNALPSVPIHELFEQQVDAFPDRIAVDRAGESVTYAALDLHASRIARGLQNAGVGIENVVAVHMTRTTAMLATLLGIAKAGAVYFPLDPANPGERNQNMLADSGAALVVFEGVAPEFAGAAIVDVQTLLNSPPTPAGPRLDPANAAYVNFTSGSGGRPKGIVITHRAVTRLVCNTNYIHLRPGDTIAHASNISFDAATFEIWGALLNGGRLVLVDRETLLRPAEYARLLRQERVNHIFLTTALFNRIVDDAPDAFAGIDNVLFGGEMSDPRRVAALIQSTPPKRLLHVYGPTEATTFSTAGPVSTAPQSGCLLSIGRPIANTSARVLDENLSHLPVGAHGQLYVGGLGLARGYHGKPAETAAVFLPDPWSEQPGARHYATGDRAAFRASGEIDILGRVDRQVKIRGFRIEPGEIEACLRDHPSVRDAAVGVRLDPDGNRQLYAVVTRSAQQSSSKTPDADEQVSRWAGVFEEHVYRDENPSADPLFNTAGWRNSFDDCPIPLDHMTAWADDIVAHVLEKPVHRVLEIGCGTGMLLFRIAPHCDAYDALDFSERSLSYVRSQIGERQGRFDHVHLRRLAADELESYQDGAFDTIILNSVAQYFPSLEYLRNVIDQGLAKLRPGGRFFLGDLRNYALMPTLHSALALFEAPPEASCDSVRRSFARIQANETELCISPEFFAALQQNCEHIAAVSVRLQNSPYANELSRYRFHAVLTKGRRQASADPPLYEDLREFDLQDLATRLRPGAIIRLRNALVAGDIAAQDALEHAPAGAAVAEVLTTSASTGVYPHELTLLARSMGLHCHTAPATDPACFDAAFTSAPLPLPMPIEQFHRMKAWEEYSNQPLYAGMISDPTKAIHEFLKKRLPPYMIPAQIVIADSLPLGPTGKIDYRALESVATESQKFPVELERESPLEEVLCGLVADVLHLPAVTRNDNFFELGGHSLLATSLAARISKAAGTDIPLKLIFEMPTVAAVAEWLQKQLERNAGFDAPPIVPVARDGLLPASFAQRRLWFLEQMRITRTAYNMPLLLELRGRIDAQALQAALNAIVERHESLRTVFYAVDGEPYQRILSHASVPFHEIDLTGVETAERRARQEQVVEELLSAHFDLTRDVLIRVTLMKFGPSEYFLAGAFHHIASDGWSVEVFVREITALYNAFLAGTENPLEPLPIQYADFAAWQRAWLQGETLEGHLAAWKRVLADAQPLRLPADHERPPVETFRGAGHHFTIPAEIASPIRSITHKHGATLFMTLLAAFKALMQRYTGQESIVLGAPIANRNRGEVEGLIGFFVNSLVLCTNLGGDPTFLELLTRVRRVALEAYTHQDLPFEKLVEELQPQRYLNQNPLFQVAFAVQQNKAMKPVFQLQGAEAIIVDLPRIDVRFDFEIHLWEEGEAIRGYVVYNADLFDASTIERMSAHYVRLLEGVAANPDLRLSQLEYMSKEEFKQLEAWS